ncbi:MAG: hypothetical protein ACT4NY_02710 [Pseudonocardiales bacterium]
MKLAGDSLHPANRVHCRVVWVTSGADGTEHAMTDEQMVAGRSGVYVARCGGQVLAASMVVPPLRRFTDCVLFLRPGQARHLLGGHVVRWTRRLLGVLRLLRSQDSPYPPSGDTPILRPDGSHGGAGQHSPTRPGPAVTHHNHAEASS